MSVLALIPARSGSRGIPGKNMRRLGGIPLVQHASDCAYRAGCDAVVISTDIDAFAVDGVVLPPFQVLWRPPELCADTAPMLDVVKHALAAIPGPDDQIVVLLQPTQPFRTPAHVREAIRLLQETQADSVVSLVELPRTHHPVFQFVVRNGQAQRGWSYAHDIGSMPATRQDVKPTYIWDGTVYAFRRATVRRYGDIYGKHVFPLIIPPEQSCELDTEADWLAVERRWREQHGA